MFDKLSICVCEFRTDPAGDYANSVSMENSHFSTAFGDYVTGVRVESLIYLIPAPSLFRGLPSECLAPCMRSHLNANFLI